jgi:uncharacterized protein YndB with AHSA1/START domain
MYILIIIIAIVAIPFILAAFVKSEYTIEKEITINKPVQEVFNYVRLVRNQENFNKWVMADPAMKKEFRGTDGTVGFVYAWDSNKRGGKGEQEIIKILDGKRVDFELRFEKPFKSTSYSWITTESSGSNQTRVQWTFRGTFNYFMKVIHTLFNMKKFLGRDLQASLVNLKNILEK